MAGGPGKPLYLPNESEGGCPPSTTLRGGWPTLLPQPNLECGCPILFLVLEKGGVKTVPTWGNSEHSWSHPVAKEGKGPSIHRFASSLRNSPAGSRYAYAS
jgi:hypothetical protein